MKHIALFENWKREETITLTSDSGQTITIELVNGTIEEIENETGITFPFFTGQPVTVFMKGWACEKSFKWNGEDPCNPKREKIEKLTLNKKEKSKNVFGIKTKYIPKGHELRHMFPGKFRD